MSILSSDDLFSKEYKPSAISAVITARVLNLLVDALAEAAAQAVAETLHPEMTWPSEPSEPELLAYIAWGNDGGRNCD